LEKQAVSDETIPQSLDVPLSALVDLAIEHWRLASWLQKMTAGRPASNAAPARYALRKIEDILKANQMEVTGMDGVAFDLGLAVRVVDTFDDPTLPAGTTLIAETVSPLVQWNGRVVKPADVVTRRGI
jgi:hypothetical protein